VGKIDRAHALWETSRLLRSRGLGLVATEVAPDWAMEGGDYNLTEVDDVSEDDGASPSSAPDGAGPPLVTAEERRRVADHAPSPDKRFHYRFAAAKLAEEAAALVPPRSQAYATLLCSAARWGDDAERLWRHYVATGAQTKAIRSFPGDCDEPNFVTARLTLDGPVVHASGRAPPSPPAPLPWWKRRRTRAAAAFVMSVLGGAGVLVRRRRRRRSHDDAPVSAEDSTTPAPPETGSPESR
jgi:hypothetical protein